MNVADLMARIADECPGFAHVSHVFAPPGEYDYPAAFVGPLKRQQAERPRMLGMYAQMIRQIFAVYVVLPKRTDAGSSSAADDLDALCDELRAALVDWRPAGSSDNPLSYAGGELAERDGLVCWREDFEGEFDLRVSP